MTVADDSSRTILLVDDEQPSRLALSTLVRQRLPKAMLVEAVDAEAALGCTEKTDFDIAFIDIDMPGQNGIELAHDLLNIDHPPLIVFATASNEHAVSAFELNAVDYLVKPFTENRVNKALSRATETLKNQTLRHSYGESTRAAIDQSNFAIKKLWTERLNGARVLVGFSEIGWASARDKDVSCERRKKSYGCA